MRLSVRWERQSTVNMFGVQGLCIANAMKHGFREALNLEFETGELSEVKLAHAQHLCDSKYATIE